MLKNDPIPPELIINDINDAISVIIKQTNISELLIFPLRLIANSNKSNTNIISRIYLSMIVYIGENDSENNTTINSE